MSVGVLLLAAGSGTRMGIPGLKQFLSINGEPVLTTALRPFVDWGRADQIVVMLPPLMLEEGRRLIADAFPALIDAAVWCTPGGSSRYRSIRLGLQALDERHDIVVVHDAVRPFVDVATLEVLVDAARMTGAAGTSMPLVDTILQVDTQGHVLASLKRSDLVASQTPQAFDARLLRTAFDALSELELDEGTECLEAARKAGANPVVVHGSPALFKITYGPDLYTAEHIDMARRRQVGVVTGATKGIGREIACQMADRGMRVVVVGRDPAACNTLAKALGGLAVPGDVSHPDTAKAVVAETIKHYGRLDVLVNNAGAARRSGIEVTSDDDWRAMIDTNLSGAFYFAREAFRFMRMSGHGGVIINIASSSIDHGRAELGAYAASKAGILLLTQTLALEGSPHGIHSFCIVPRGTDTELRRRLYPEREESDLLEPGEVARMVLSCIVQWMPHLSGQAFWVR